MKAASDLNHSSRVHNQILIYQYKSEFLVAGFQLSLIALLFFIDFFLPQDYSPGAPVHSSQLGLSLFTIIVLVRLWFAWSKQLNFMLLSISVIGEVLLLLFIIWTYYLQYETTAIINLKSSLFFYFFVLIALRSLRYEPIWVLLSGFTAAIGWTLLVGYTLMSTGMNALTWDYVTYTSTGSIYPGTELNMVLSLLFVTGIIAISQYRGRAILYKSVDETLAVEELSRFFDSTVAKKITDSPEIIQSGYGETRQAAILIADLRGFTKASESLSPSDLIALLAEYQRIIIPIIQKHHGSIDKFMGDGILCSFGAVTQSASYAADALRSVDEIIASFALWKNQRALHNKITLSLGLGVASGEVIFGIIGNENRLEYTVIGEPVNIAAKLEKHNKVEDSQVLTTLITYNEALSQGYTSQGPKPVKCMNDIADLLKSVDPLILSKTDSRFA